MMTSPRDVTHSAIRTIALVALVVSVTLTIQGRLAPRAAAQAPDDFDDLDNPAVAGVIVGYDVNRLRITTDRASYAIGQAIRFCYTVPAPGRIAILDYQPNGRTTELLGGFDDGRGDCINGTVTPPAGRECLRIRFFFPGGGSMSRATCFDVLGTPPAPPPPPPPLAGATSQYLRVTVSGASATVFWQNTPGASGEWVSVVRVGVADGAHEGRWAYTGTQRSGSYMTAGLAPGEYEARLYRDGGYTMIIGRVRFRVPDTAAAGPTVGQATCSFAGNWTSDVGGMVLTVSGSRITGTYRDGRATLEATQTGNRASGRWSDNPRVGRFQWTMAADCRSFTGLWGFNEAPVTNGWNGRRIGDPPPAPRAIVAPPESTETAASTPMPPAPLPEALDQRDFDAFCRWHWEGLADGAVLDEGIWFCLARDPLDSGIEVRIEIEDMDAVCRFKTGQDRARARQQAASDPHSWTCVTA